MKTFIQLDVQNLFFSAKDLGRKIDFFKIKDYFAKSVDELVGLHAYIIRSPNFSSLKFENLLKSLGYVLHIKKAQIGFKRDGSPLYKGTDQDMAICIDCMKSINEFDKWVLMSGDGDFIDLCQYLKSKGKNIDVWTVRGSSFNKGLCDFADTIKFFDDSFFYNPETVSDQESTSVPVTEPPITDDLEGQ